jgi:hypothetical protein
MWIFRQICVNSYTTFLHTFSVHGMPLHCNYFGQEALLSVTYSNIYFVVAANLFCIVVTLGP